MTEQRHCAFYCDRFQTLNKNKKMNRIITNCIRLGCRIGCVCESKNVSLCVCAMSDFEINNFPVTGRSTVQRCHLPFRIIDDSLSQATLFR